MKKHLLTTALVCLLLLLLSQAARAGQVWGESIVGYDSHSRVIFGYSATWLDYSAGYYYDPSVEGFLLWDVDDETPLDSGWSDGYANIIPAEVWLYSTQYRPATWYETYSNHFIIAYYYYYDDYYGSYYWYDPLGFNFFSGGSYGGWFSGFSPGYYPYNYVTYQYYYLFATDVRIKTPSDICPSAPLSLDENGAPCPTPTPTPTPTPSPSPSPTPLTSVQVTEVGFTGGHSITTWAEGLPSNQHTIAPTEPTWKKTANPNYPAAYTKGAHPSIFANLTIVPNLSTTKTVKIRVKKGTDVIATKDNVNLIGSSVHVEGLEITPQLEGATAVKAGDYTFSWEVSFDNGSNWATMGDSGPQKIYWTYATPQAPLPADSRIYDLALEKSAGAANGESDSNAIIGKINEGVATGVVYNPNGSLGGFHPLFAFNPNVQIMCYENALLLQVLLRSIGLDGEINFVWGGDANFNEAWRYRYVTPTLPLQVTMRMNRPIVNDADGGPYPHFDYHAVLKVNNRYFDPSYGDSDTTVRIDETYNMRTSSWASGANASANLVIKPANFVNSIDSHKNCPHSTSSPPPNPNDNASTFVRQQYLDILHREPDANGWTYWTGQITTCGVDLVCEDTRRKDVATAFFFSGEFIQSNPNFANPNTTSYNSAFVTQCYVSYLQRQPDNGGYQFWYGILNSQIPNSNYPGMVRTFITSAEYRLRFGTP